MATPFPFFSTRHRFIRLPVWKKIARPRTSFWTTDTFTDFFHGSLRFRKRFKPTSSRHFRTSNLTFVSIFDPSSIFLFFFFSFFFNSRSKEQNVEIVGWISERGNSWQTFTLHTSGEQIRIFVPVQLEYLFRVGI